MLFLCLRTPFELLHGFIYDEEGTVYLRYAWDAGPWRALLAPHQGYYSLFANLCGVITARVLPLAQAGHFLFFAELAIQMLLVYMLVQCECFRSYRQKAVAVAIGLLSPPTDAIALSTIHAQFFLAVVTAVILISDAERLRRRRLLALGLAGLTGATSCVLLPLFVFQAWNERTRARTAQALVMAICVIVQSGVIYFQPWVLHSPHSTVGFYSASLVANGVLGHYFTRTSWIEACKSVGSTRVDSWRGLWWFGMELGSALYLAVLAVASEKAGRAARLLCCAAIFSLALSFKRSGAINADLMCGAGGRYFFAFNLLTGLILLLLWSRRLPRWSHLAAALLFGCIVSGVLDLRVIRNRPHLPVWADEVAAWRALPAHRLEIRPGYWPAVKLTPASGAHHLPADIYDTTVPGWQEK